MLKEKEKRPNNKREDEVKSLQNRGEERRNLEREKGENHQ